MSFALSFSDASLETHFPPNHLEAHLPAVYLRNHYLTLFMNIVVCRTTKQVFHDSHIERIFTWKMRPHALYMMNQDVGQTKMLIASVYRVILVQNDTEDHSPFCHENCWTVFWDVLNMFGISGSGSGTPSDVISSSRRNAHKKVHSWTFIIRWNRYSVPTVFWHISVAVCSIMCWTSCFSSTCRQWHANYVCCLFWLIWHHILSPPLLLFYGPHFQLQNTLYAPTIKTTRGNEKILSFLLIAVPVSRLLTLSISSHNKTICAPIVVSTDLTS